MRIVFPQDCGIYQQDIAECHTTDSVRAWFKEHQDQFIVLPCPENSPDLSPINNLWNPLNRVVRVMDPHALSHSAPGQKGPVIEGNLPWYHVGDLVNLTCSSAKSPIPVHIRWFVNDMEAKSEHLIKYPTIRYSDGTEVSSLGLRMKVEHYHFKSDELRIKCTTTLYRMLTMRAEKTLFRYNQQNSGFHTAENRCAGYLSTTEKMPLRRISAYYDQLFEFEIDRIIGLKETGLPIQRIARHMGRSDAAFRRCLQEWMDNFRFQRHDGSGLPRATTEQ
ncbi:DUF1758 domain-containing protein [Trichonephila clavipes]|nr:DUF1758 domain-containing protein [Trichonephila clavipes]